MRGGFSGAAALLTILLSACGDVSIKPRAVLPRPLIVPLPAAVGLIIPAETRHYVDRETRYGTEWKIDLGPGEVRHLQDVFRDLFERVEDFKDLQAARGARDLRAIFETRVDQFSFVTARETGGRYYAVTIRYRINLYTPDGERVDSYTLTGYGNALARGMSGAQPLEQAAAAAMRDAAAKFLVQFPDQPPGQRLARDESVVADKPAVSAEVPEIEAVPIDEPNDSPDPTETTGGIHSPGASNVPGPSDSSDPAPSAGPRS